MQGTSEIGGHRKLKDVSLAKEMGQPGECLRDERRCGDHVEAAGALGELIEGAAPLIEQGVREVDAEGRH